MIIMISIIINMKLNLFIYLFRYVPYVGDSKRAMDEYISEIFMGGTVILITILIIIYYDSLWLIFIYY